VIDRQRAKETDRQIDTYIQNNSDAEIRRDNKYRHLEENVDIELVEWRER